MQPDHSGYTHGVHRRTAARYRNDRPIPTPVRASLQPGPVAQQKECGSGSRTVIYVTNDGGHRYDLALRRIPEGKLTYMTVGSLNPTRLDRIALELGRHIGMSRSEDWLLLSGHPAINAIAMTLSMQKHGEVRVLVYDAKMDSYAQRVVTGSNFERLLGLHPAEQLSEDTPG